MALWVPIALLAGVAAAVFSQRSSSSSPSTCGKLSPGERAELDRFLAASPEIVLAVGRSFGHDKAQTVHMIHTNATQLDELGCKLDGDRVRAKADAVAKLTEPPVHVLGHRSATSPATASPSLDSGYPPTQLTGSFVAPEVRVGFAAGDSPPTQHGVAPGTTARLDQAFDQAFSPGAASPGGPGIPQVPRSPPIALMRTKARVTIRPEPVAWNDEVMGKLGFSVPAGFPVGVLAFGPPTCPPGFAKIELKHPDENEGLVEGFTEAANLVPPQAPAAQRTAAATGAARSPTQQQPSFQGRSRTRARAQAAKTKARAKAPTPG